MGALRCLILFSLYRAAAAASEGWCYPSQQCDNPGCKEPRSWVDLYPECGGEEQSPINIVTSKAEINWELKPFEYINYQVKQGTNWTIKNTGHSVQVDLDGSARIGQENPPNQYKALQFHFHWGREINSSHKMEPGSEHTVNGERYAMEVHIVHVKEEFPNVTVAATKKGVAVLGFFVEISGEENKNYTPLISKLKDIPSPGDEQLMEPLPLLDLIPPKENLTKYYRYTGSLTTPDCNEGVTWTLFQEPIKLSLSQVQEFWTELYFDKTKNLLMKDNFRPLQPLGNRIVYKSDSNALAPPAKTLLLLLLPAATYLLFSFTQ